MTRTDARSSPLGVPLPSFKPRGVRLAIGYLGTISPCRY